MTLIIRALFSLRFCHIHSFQFSTFKLFVPLCYNLQLGYVNTCEPNQRNRCGGNCTGRPRSEIHTENEFSLFIRAAITSWRHITSGRAHKTYILWYLLGCDTSFYGVSVCTSRGSPICGRHQLPQQRRLGQKENRYPGSAHRDCRSLHSSLLAPENYERRFP